MTRGGIATLLAALACVALGTSAVAGRGTLGNPGVPLVPRASGLVPQAQVAAQQGRLDEALQLYQRALLQGGPETEVAAAREGLGWCRAWMGDAVAAVAVWRDALQRTTDAATLLALRGDLARVLARQPEHEAEALALLETVRRSRAAGEGSLEVVRGWLLASAGDTAAATAAWRGTVPGGSFPRVLRAALYDGACRQWQLGQDSVAWSVLRDLAAGPAPDPTTRVAAAVLARSHRATITWLPALAVGVEPATLALLSGTSDSPVRPHERLASLDGEPVRDWADLQVILLRMHPGSRVTLVTEGGRAVACSVIALPRLAPR